VARPKPRAHTRSFYLIIRDLTSCDTGLYLRTIDGNVGVRDSQPAPVCTVMHPLATPPSIDSSSHRLTLLALRTAFDNLRCPRTPARPTPPHPSRHLARTRALDLCRQALDIVALAVVVARCALQLHLRLPLSGWGRMDCVGWPGAGVQGGASDIDRTRLARYPAEKRVRCGGRGSSSNSSLHLRPRFRLCRCPYPWRQRCLCHPPRRPLRRRP
jgi:hypothetical protein